MNTYNNLLILGNGSWGNKVKKAIESNLSNIVADIYPYRSFNTININKYDVVWICNKPQDHIKALELFENFKGIVIIEKPISINILDYDDIKTLSLFKNNQIRFSKIWNFSDVWESFYKNLPDDIDSIDIFRYGNASAVDWIPHDLFLINYIFPSNNFDIEILKLEHNEIRANIFYEFCKIKLSVGYGNRKAEWVIKTKNDSIRIDFNSKKIYKNEEVVYSSLGNSDAICKFYQSMPSISNKETLGDLDYQKKILLNIL